MCACVCVCMCVCVCICLCAYMCMCPDASDAIVVISANVVADASSDTAIVDIVIIVGESINFIAATAAAAADVASLVCVSERERA